jgi:hypothetical protein
MEHNHQCCPHANLRWCPQCQVVYCLDCGQEWSDHHYRYVWNPCYPYSPTTWETYTDTAGGICQYSMS